MDHEEEPDVASASAPAVDLPPPKKKAGRKKVARSKKVKRPKERGKYQSIYSVGAGDVDLADCLYSDDELREEYLTQCNEPSGSLTSLETSEAGTTMDNISNQSSESVHSSMYAGSDSSRPASSLDLSRPISALSHHSVNEDLSAVNESQISEVSCEDSVINESAVCVDVSPSAKLIEIALEKFRSLLLQSWVPIADKDGFHLMLVSRRYPKAIQREISVSYMGNVQMIMHCKTVPDFSSIFKLDPQNLIPFEENSVDQYCHFGFELTQKFMQYESCIGANDLESRSVWEKVSGGIVDTNQYKEERFTETYRSSSCSIIVELGVKKRCTECTTLLKTILKRKPFLLSPIAAPSTKNEYLTKEQALHKLQTQQEENRKKDKKISYLLSRVNKLIESEGVNIDDDLNESFSRILMSSDKLTEGQKIFIQEQWSSAHASSSRAHRWHPAMIRFALQAHMSSSGTYEDVRASGFLRLPHSRTLFDYSHAIEAKDGVNEGLIKLVVDRVGKLEEPHKEFHVLMCDGMHISQNLVFRSSDGSLVGFAKLDEVDRELERLDKFIAGKDAISSDPPLAKEVLAYLVKGMASDVKCVIASFPFKIFTKEMMYKRTWDVIRHLETAGIKILALICDGHPINRAFMMMHTPFTTGTTFSCIFDTINFCAPEKRLLFFISDVCHLLKTIRNAFFNSGEGPKKPRLLTINGEIITWKTIVRLYFQYKNNNFRKSYKLNAQNVFPDSYSRMKVRYAAQPMSNTVAQDIEDQKWPGTEETVRFIRLIDRFFDCLNGAHTSMANRKNKPDLAPYTVDNIDYEVKEGRFKFLRDFIAYLADWKKQVYRLPLSAEEKEKRILPIQTLIGIETSIRAIEAATVYFLDPQKGGGKFVNARIFSQDPLEQHFSKQRGRGGGSRNPNVAQFQQGQVVTALQRGLGVRKRKGNSTEEDVSVEVVSEPLPKKARYSKK